MAHLSLGLRLLLALVCLAAVLGKVRGRQAFADFRTAVEMVARSVPAVRAPARFARRWAVPVLLAELGVAALVPWPATAAIGGGIAVALFAALAAGVMVAVVTGAPAGCACFGRVTRRLGPEHVTRNLVLTGAAGVSWLLTLSVGPAGPPSAAGVLVCAVAAAAAAAVIVGWDDLSVLLFDRITFTSEPMP